MTGCARLTCREPGHVVLFSPGGGPFDGQHHPYGTRVVYCLRHGADIYDARKGDRERAGWVVGTLPVPLLPEHTATDRRERRRPHWTDRTPNRARRDDAG